MNSCTRDQAFTLAGFPHSDICGLMDICSLPQLIAACHVLLRLSVPRHSPCALCNLTCCGSLLRRYPDTDEAFLKTCSLSSGGTSVPRTFLCKTLFLCFSLSSIFSVFFSLCSFQGAWSRPRGHTRPQLRLKVDVVGSSGLEPPTLRLSGARSNHLSYEPMGSRDQALKIEQ